MGHVLSSSVLAAPSPQNTGFRTSSYLGRVIRPGAPSHPLPLVVWSAHARNPQHAVVFSHLSTRLVPVVMQIVIEFLQTDVEVFFIRHTQDDQFRVRLHGEIQRFSCFVVPTLHLPMRAAVANCLYCRSISSHATQQFMLDILEALGNLGGNVQCQIVQNSLVIAPC